MPVSASMFYGSSDNDGPGNRSSTPTVRDCVFSNLSIYLPAHAASTPSTISSKPKPSFQFLGLPESLMSGFHFADITVHSGESHGWQCVNTSSFSFDQISPAPAADSGCV
jgi:hypothetical protein